MARNTLIIPFNSVFFLLKSCFVFALLWWVALPGFACRMLLIVQTQPDVVDVQERFITSSRSLRNQAQTEAPWFQLGGQSIKNNFYGSSDQNHDGFGLVAFTKNLTDTVYERNVHWVQSGESTKQLTETIQATAKTTYTYLGHIRAASPNTSVVEANNHPYKVVRNENEIWYFMANGGISVPQKAYKQKLKQHPWLTTYASKAPLPSDSEQLFHWLLADVDKTLGKGFMLNASTNPLVEESLRRSFSKLLAQQKLVTYQPSLVTTSEIPVNEASNQALVRAIGKTWIMSKGNYTYLAVYNNDVWMQVKKAETGLIEAVVVASEPTNLAEFYKAGQQFKAGWSRWQQLPNNTLFTIQQQTAYHAAGTSPSVRSVNIRAHSFTASSIKVAKKLYTNAKNNSQPSGVSWTHYADSFDN